MDVPDNLQAIGNGVIVRRLYGKKLLMEKTPNGLLLPEREEYDDDHYSVGQVVSVGQKCTELKSGDTVLYRSHLAQKLPHNILERPVYYKLEERADMISAILPK